MYINAGFQQHSTITHSETWISQDTSTSRTKRGGESTQQAIPGLAMVWCRDTSRKTCQVSYKQHSKSESQI